MRREYAEPADPSLFHPIIRLTPLLIVDTLLLILTETKMTPATPTTPTRPARSHRSSVHSSTSEPSTPTFDSPPPLQSTPSTAASSRSEGPVTPSTPTRTHQAKPSISSRKSSSSVRRKPVPINVDDIELELYTLPNPSSAWSSRRSNEAQTPREAPTYTLPVDPPCYLSSSSYPPSHSFEIDTGVHDIVVSVEELPRYAAEGETEPKTLAKGLWRWGWLCPLLWAIGMCM